MKGRVFAVAIVALLGCTCTGPALAQVTWEAGFKGGVSAFSFKGSTRFFESLTDGVNTFDFSGDISDVRTGFAGGAFASAGITDAFGVRLELLYAQKGAKGTLDLAVNGSPAGTANITYKVDYIEIPILAVGSIPAGGETKVNFFGGPAVAFRTSAKVKAEVEGQSDEQDISEGLESSDFGFAAGAGLETAASSRVHVVMDARYTFGLSQVFKSGDDIKNGGFTFMAGIAFPLGGGRAHH
jgi:opacity protein-like surface antigen